MMMAPATLRLFWIETRRSAALWCVPVLVILAWLAADQSALQSSANVTLWAITSQQIASALILVAPAAGGIAAWASGRDRRRGIEDLLRTTPRPAVERDLAGLAASTIWAIVACLAVAIYLGVVAYRDATWGGPLFSPIGIGLLTLLVGAAVGFVLGMLIPGRFTPPLVAVGIFLALAIPTAAPYHRSEGADLLIPSNLHYLTPMAITEDVAYPIFLEPWPDIAGQQALWLLGLGVVALFGLALLRRATPIAWAGLFAGVATAGVGVASLMSVDFHQGAAIPYTPACVQNAGSVEVCVHPAFEARLADTATVVDAVMAPLIGIPGTPLRVEQAVDRGYYEPAGDITPDGTLRTFPIEVIAPSDVTARTLVLDLVWNPASRESNGAGPEDVQMAMALWLMGRGGFDDQREDNGLWELYADANRAPAPSGGNLADAPADVSVDARAAIDDAVARFAALDAATQRTWLEANWADLRAGRLTLNDLP